MLNRNKKQEARNKKAAGLAPIGLGLVCLMAGVVTGQLPDVQGSLDAVEILTPATTKPAGTMPTLTGGMIPGHPKKIEGPKSGALRVVMSQGTKGGPTLGNDPVTVKLYSLGKLLKTYKTELKGGVVELMDLPVDVGYQPAILVEHGGVEQLMIGVPMGKYDPRVELEMPIYEVSTEKPAWTVGIRKIDILPSEQDGEVGVFVTEMMGGYNPTDKAWKGETTSGGKETRTVVWELPAGAKNVQFGPGLLEAGAHVDAGTVVRGMAMMPGETEYTFGYFVGAKEGKASLRFVAPTETRLFAAYMPATFKVEKLTGLTAGNAGGALGDQGRKLLVAKNMKIGTAVDLEISGIKAPPKPAPPTTEPEGFHLPRPAK